MSIRAGDLRHRIRIDQRSTARDEAGGQSLVWTEVATIWAALERTPGSEVWASAQRQGRVPVVFRCRYRAGVTSSMRVVFDDLAHDIRSVVDPSGKRAEMLLVTDEHVEEVVEDA
jgi:SPP1 family predicted phage head-tail adaptor